MQEDGEGEQPAREKLPGGEGEEVEIERAAEDGVGDGAGGVRGVPVEGQGGPLRLHGCAGAERDERGDQDRRRREDRADGQVDGIAADEDGVVAGQVGGVARA